MKILQNLRLSSNRLSITFGTMLILSIVLAACSEKASEPTRAAHPTGWVDTSSANFHGKFLADRGSPEGLQACQSCHGEPGSVNATGVSCFSCHAQFPHPVGWSGSGTANLHQTYIQQKGWRMDECKTCHGADFRTAKTFQDTSSISCFSCHAGNSGPIGCKTCHGGAASSAPPADLLGGTSTDLITVGAHTAHVLDEGTFAKISCANCHAGFSGYANPAHIDTTTPGRAEVVFGVIATDSGRISPVWDRNAGTCSSIYCHGSFGGGNGVVPQWIRTGQAECGSCHNLPPTTHTSLPQQQACSICHVFEQATHVDGVVNMR